jgi:hypothetical protein
MLSATHGAESMSDDYARVLNITGLAFIRLNLVLCRGPDCGRAIENIAAFVVEPVKDQVSRRRRPGTGMRSEVMSVYVGSALCAATQPDLALPTRSSDLVIGISISRGVSISSGQRSPVASCDA